MLTLTADASLPPTHNALLPPVIVFEAQSRSGTNAEESPKQTHKQQWTCSHSPSALIYQRGSCGNPRRGTRRRGTRKRGSGRGGTRRKGTRRRGSGRERDQDSPSALIYQRGSCGNPRRGTRSERDQEEREREKRDQEERDQEEREREREGSGLSISTYLPERQLWEPRRGTRSERDQEEREREGRDQEEREREREGSGLSISTYLPERQLWEPPERD
uniref:Uncharacterized protein n=1 Tax=Knipowitschia caucasica TaxID=637954 RepID=A0AAV2LVW7_KNICA